MKTKVELEQGKKEMTEIKKVCGEAPQYLTEKEISQLNGLRRRGSEQAVLHLWMPDGKKVAGYLEATGNHTHNNSFVHLGCNAFSRRSDIRKAEQELRIRGKINAIEDKYENPEEVFELEREIEENWLN